MLNHSFPSGESDPLVSQGYVDYQVFFFFFYQNTQSFLLPHAIVVSFPPSLWATARKQRDRLISSLTKKTEVLGRKSLITPRSQATDDLQVTSALWGGGKALAWSQSAPGFPGRPHKCLAKNRLSCSSHFGDGQALCVER